MTRTTIALLAALLLPAAPAQAKPALSVQDEAAITCDYWGLRASALEAAKDLGAKVVRVNLIEWNNCDAAASAATAIAAAGLKPQLTLIGSPGWIKAQVLRDRRLVSTYSIWNEPELATWRCCNAPFHTRAWGAANPAAYHAGYLRAYRAVKRLDPRSKVLIGEMSPHGIGGTAGLDMLHQTGRRRWFGRVLNAGQPLKADGVAIHPYTWKWSSSVDGEYFRQLAAFKRAVRRYAQRGMLTTPKGRAVPVYNTEYGQRRWDGTAGDATNAARAYRYSTRLGFRQHNQYMIFPAFHPDHSTHEWNTAVTTNGCRPAAAYFALRRAVTGRKGRGSKVAWPDCPDPIPGVTPPLPPGYGTPGYRTPDDPYS